MKKVWKDRDVTTNTKKRLLQTLIFSVFKYGSESWTLKKADLKKIDSFEYWCWRRMLNIHWTSRTRNIEVLEKVKPDMPLQAIILKQKLGYLGHIVKARNSMEKEIQIGIMEGDRRRGRPRTRWWDDLKAATGKNIKELIEEAEDCRSWRKFILVVARSRHRLDGTR